MVKVLKILIKVFVLKLLVLEILVPKILISAGILIPEMLFFTRGACTKKTCAEDANAFEYLEMYLQSFQILVLKPCKIRLETGVGAGWWIRYKVCCKNCSDWRDYF